MTMVTKNKCEYADVGLGTILRIEDSIRIGATTVEKGI